MAFDPMAFLASMNMGPEPEQEGGQFSRYSNIPGADESIAQNLMKLKEFNQREQENQMREKLTRLQNSMMGARYSGDDRGQQSAMMGIEQLMKGVGALDSRDVQNRQITSQEDMASQLNELNRQLGNRRIDSEDRRVDKVNETAQKGQETQERIAAGDRGSNEKIQGMKNASTSEGIQSQERIALADRQIRQQMAQLASESEMAMLEKKLASGEKLSEREMQLKKIGQALSMKLMQDPQDDRANEVLDKILRQESPSMFERAGRVVLNPMEALLRSLGG